MTRADPPPRYGNFHFFFWTLPLIDLFFFASESIPKNSESLFFASFPSVLKTEGFSLFLVAIISNKIFFIKVFGHLFGQTFPPLKTILWPPTSSPMVPQKWGFEPQPDFSIFLCVSCQLIVSVDPIHFFCKKYLEICCTAFYISDIELRI